MRFLLLAAFLAVALSSVSAESSPRFYIRHRRSAVEREGKPAKESTTVVATSTDSTSKGTSDSAAADLPEELKPHVKENEKDCKDFFELDYNPRRDMFAFNGQIPNFFHPFGPQNGTSGPVDPGMQHIQNMFHHMMSQASQMFNRFPMQHPGAEVDGKKYPDNYNGTTEDVIDIGGEKFVKKTKIINKVIDGVHVHLMSTTLEKAEPEGGDKLPGGDEKKVKVPTSGSDEDEEVPVKETRNPNAEELSTKKPNDLTDGTVVAY